jgi:homoaconitase/3-isopropylmalate dehydratase large subunit
MPSAVKPPQTLYDKVFQDHIVEEKDDGTILLYIGTILSPIAAQHRDLTNLQTDIWSTKSHHL